MEFKDYYKIMGVARDATQDEIKRAYRQLARKYHPDVSKADDAEIRFKELGEANAVLKDLEKRAAYDQLGHQWQAGQDFQPPPHRHGGFEFSGSENGPAGEDFSDFFESLFGQARSGADRRQANVPQRGEDHHARVQIDLEDAYNGITRSITLRNPVLDEQGRIIMRSHTLNVSIPRGIHAGQHIRLAGQGGPGIGEGIAGDLLLKIEFLPHPHFRIEQRDVYLDLPLAPWEAVLGTSLTIPLPNGQVELKIPPGSNAGNKLRLKGKGIPGTSPGDFYAVLRIALPPAKSEPAIAFYRDMASHFSTFSPRAGLGV